MASHKLAFRLGQEIARQGKTLTTGATVGLPRHAAMGLIGVKGRTGLSIGFSTTASFMLFPKFNDHSQLEPFVVVL